MEKIDPLGIRLLDDGSACLEQDFGGNTETIYLHSIHVRYLVELAGKLAPERPDELTRRLARQLWKLRDGLVSEYGSSPGIDRLCVMATAFVDCLPESLLPFAPAPGDQNSDIGKAKNDARNADAQQALILLQRN